ncbi:MAG: lysophospholipid acyltransferase family protein [Actinomycetota bacterium]|nr:lysophospholipid acyltransferase family protein [Actinomycetota bacterium]
MISAMKAQGAGKAQTRARTTLAPVARRLWSIKISGLDRLPESGPAILCPNHVSFLDSAFLMLVVQRNISFVGKAEYMDSWKTKILFPMMGMIPIDRSGGEKSQAALDAAEGVLARGELFGMFPEGTRSRDGSLYKGRTGAARLATKIGCPIFPVGIVGTNDIQPPNAKVPKLFRSCTITIGRPIRPERYTSSTDPHMAWRSMIDEVMFEVQSMTGQVYKNVYAGKTADSEPITTAKVGHVQDQQTVSSS